MSRKFFGTDGVRGRANTHPMTAEMALRLGAAAGRYFRRDGKNGHRVVIGKDTRLSGYMLENALTAGLTSTGMNVLLLGPVPTPAVGFLTRSMRADLGIMISASHNPAADNGIKFFGPDGFKLSDEAEAEIERIVAGEIAPAQPGNIGRAKRIDDGRGRYVEYAKTTFPAGQRLDGLKVVIDCANGAAYRAAPDVLWELGAEVIPLGVDPNGLNINEGVGSTHPEACARAVLEHGADLGIAHDGDADRCLAVDAQGNVVDGDQIMAILATGMKESNSLKDNTLVATVMSNLGLKLAMQREGIEVRETKVGDRYVLEELGRGDFSLGGEQSGHIVVPAHATTGDGVLSGLMLMQRMAETGKTLAELAEVMTVLPQTLINVPVSNKALILEDQSVKDAIAEAEAELGEAGRVLLRPSGTEELFRVMVEAAEEEQARKVAGRLAAVVAAV